METTSQTIICYTPTVPTGECAWFVWGWKTFFLCDFYIIWYAGSVLQIVEYFNQKNLLVKFQMTIDLHLKKLFSKITFSLLGIIIVCYSWFNSLKSAFSISKLVFSTKHKRVINKTPNYYKQPKISNIQWTFWLITI